MATVIARAKEYAGGQRSALACQSSFSAAIVRSMFVSTVSAMKANDGLMPDSVIRENRSGISPLTSQFTQKRTKPATGDIVFLRALLLLLAAGEAYDFPNLARKNARLSQIPHHSDTPMLDY